MEDKGMAIEVVFYQEIFSGKICLSKR